VECEACRRSVWIDRGRLEMDPQAQVVCKPCAGEMARDGRLVVIPARLMEIINGG
jgi:hypothetical protein